MHHSKCRTLLAIFFNDYFVRSVDHQADEHSDSWLGLLKGMQSCLKGKKFSQVRQYVVQFMLGFCVSLSLSR